MLNRFQTIAETLHSNAGILAAGQAWLIWQEILVVGICITSLSILIIWLFFRGGPTTLKNAPVRRNRMSPFLPLILIVTWILMMSAFSWTTKSLFPDISNAKQQIVSHGILVASELPLIGAMLIIAYSTFARGLKGFGLNPRTLAKDAGFAFINLLAVYPLILAGLYIVQFVGKWITQNPDFGVESHQSLILLADSTNPIIKILIISVAVIVAPVFEELLFRGFLQTSIRSVTNNSYIAILISSTIFVVIHPSYQHWPALFALACGLGYAYERSGSLFRPIIMHVLFNGVSVIFTLITAP